MLSEQVTKLIREHADLQDESRKIEKARAKAQAVVDRVLKDGIADESETRELGDAQLMLQLCEPRQKRCEKLMREIEVKIQGPLSDAARAFNRRVRDLAEAKTQEALAAMARFCDDERQARRLLKEVEFPAVRKIRRLSWTMPYDPAPPADFYWKAVQQFEAHVARTVKLMPALAES